MITMQYSFTFPADYDMAIIRKRVQEKGTSLDKHEPLVFKSYLIAVKNDNVTKSKENVYAPFYLWKDTKGMTDFITSIGFKGLVNSFGQPVVKNWPCIISSFIDRNITDAKFATKELEQISPYYDFNEIKRQEELYSEKAIKENNSLLSISAFEPKDWTLVRFNLRTEINKFSDKSVQVYNVLHTSFPAKH